MFHDRARPDEQIVENVPFLMIKNTIWEGQCCFISFYWFSNFSSNWTISSKNCYQSSLSIQFPYTMVFHISNNYVRAIVVLLCVHHCRKTCSQTNTTRKSCLIWMAQKNSNTNMILLLNNVKQKNIKKQLQMLECQCT